MRPDIEHDREWAGWVGEPCGGDGITGLAVRRQDEALQPSLVTERIVNPRNSPRQLVDAVALGQRSQARLTMLYRSTTAAVVAAQP
jgi:hypothetical protein